jgi:hypothetical protein
VGNDPSPTRGDPPAPQRGAERRSAPRRRIRRIPHLAGERPGFRCLVRGPSGRGTGRGPRGAELGTRCRLAATVGPDLLRLRGGLVPHRGDDGSPRLSAAPPVLARRRDLGRSAAAGPCPTRSGGAHPKAVFRIARPPRWWPPRVPVRFWWTARGSRGPACPATVLPRSRTASRVRRVATSVLGLPDGRTEIRRAPRTPVPRTSLRRWVDSVPFRGGPQVRAHRRALSRSACPRDPAANASLGNPREAPRIHDPRHHPGLVVVNPPKSPIRPVPPGRARLNLRGQLAPLASPPQGHSKRSRPPVLRPNPGGERRGPGSSLEGRVRTATRAWGSEPERQAVSSKWRDSLT